MWVDQSGSTYTNWESGEPNDDNGIEDCVHMRSEFESREYKWNDLPCNVSYDIPYVCETRGKSGSIMLYVVQPNAKFVYQSLSRLNTKNQRHKPSLKLGWHLCDKHKTSDISISTSTRKEEHVPCFLCLCLCLCRLCYAYRTSVNQA